MPFPKECLLQNASNFHATHPMIHFGPVLTNAVTSGFRMLNFDLSITWPNEFIPVGDPVWVRRQHQARSDRWIVRGMCASRSDIENKNKSPVPTICNCRDRGCVTTYIIILDRHPEFILGSHYQLLKDPEPSSGWLRIQLWHTLCPDVFSRDGGFSSTRNPGKISINNSQINYKHRQTSNGNEACPVK